MLESDLDLIHSCRQGNAGAWEQLLDRYERLVYSIPLQYGLSVDDAADVAQITFTILLQSLDTLWEDTRLGPWLVTVARRHTWRVLAGHRRQSGRDLNDVEDLPLTDDEGLRHPTSRWETTEWLHNGLNRLDRRCRDLLLALYFDPDEPSYAEVAARFGLAVGSIGPTRGLCLQRLKKLLEGQ
ncbi:MAG: sigma-70 family RNA polymerase sigma factor [Chloroflexota bacterium]